MMPGQLAHEYRGPHINTSKRYPNLEDDSRSLAYLQMTPQERMDVARLLKLKVYPPDAKDVRACHRIP